MDIHILDVPVPVYREPVWIFAAGIAGALVRIVVVTPRETVAKVAHVATGALMALFVAPAIDLHWLATETLEMQRATAFAVGAIGPLVMEVVVHLVQRRGDNVADRFADRLADRFAHRATVDSKEAQSKPAASNGEPGK